MTGGRAAVRNAVLAWSIICANGQNGPDHKKVSLVRATEPIKVDGLLTEAAWTNAATAIELVQQSPRPGESTPYRTVLRVLLVEDRLVIGFDCADPEPERIAVHTMQRDGVFTGDDNVTIMLDTYYDKKTGYMFQVNAAGARTDGLISGPDRSSLDWDGIWDARVARTDRGGLRRSSSPSRPLASPRGWRTGE